MESQITLSPWHANAIKAGRIIGDETVNDTFDKITINSHNATVATVYRRADARLIKAAPELLEACEPDADPPGPDFLEWLACRLVSVYGESENVSHVHALRRKAEKMRSAIAKAKGE